ASLFFNTVNRLSFQIPRGEFRQSGVRSAECGGRDEDERNEGRGRSNANTPAANSTPHPQHAALRIPNSALLRTPWPLWTLQTYTSLRCECSPSILALRTSGRLFRTSSGFRSARWRLCEGAVQGMISPGSSPWLKTSERRLWSLDCPSRWMGR